MPWHQKGEQPALFDDISPIQIAALQAVNQHLCGGDVGGDGDVVHIAQAQHVHIVCLVGLLVERIAEEQQHVNFVAGDARGNLLVHRS